MIIDNQIIVDFQKKIWDRYAVHKRDLPRRETQDPYEVRISESMLCQTQVSRVIDYYHKWLELFPTVEMLANASNEQVLRARSGLGYNSRALRLKQAAMQVMGSEFGVRNWFPNTYEDLIKLPGVGDYIANAVLAFAFDQDVVVVDTNIRRIMIHEFLGAKSEKRKAKGSKDDLVFDFQSTNSFPSNDVIKELVRQTLPKGRSRARYNALMDYGALELTSIKTGIKPLTKQSKFAGSARQIRAGIVKQVLNSKLGVLSYGDIQKLYPEREDLDQVIDKMIKDSLIIRNDNVIMIKA